MAIVATVAAYSANSAPITRVDRCNALERQFDHAIIQHARAKRATQARALQKKAQKFCAGKEQAQGIRAYAQALKLLGVKPIEQ
jgi:hypothetical protein